MQINLGKPKKATKPEEKPEVKSEGKPAVTKPVFNFKKPAKTTKAIATAEKNAAGKTETRKQVLSKPKPKPLDLLAKPDKDDNLAAFKRYIEDMRDYLSHPSDKINIGNIMRLAISLLQKDVHVKENVAPDDMNVVLRIVRSTSASKAKQVQRGLNKKQKDEQKSADWASDLADGLKF